MAPVLLSKILLFHGLHPIAHSFSVSLPTCGSLSIGRALLMV
jgi:hypothetical protein